MRRAFDMYQQIDHDDWAPAAHDESGLRRVRRGHRGHRPDWQASSVYPSLEQGVVVEIASTLACPHDERYGAHAEEPVAFADHAFVDDATVAVCEDPVQQRVFVSERPGTQRDPRAWAAHAFPGHGRRGAKPWRTVRSTGISSERIVIEALATLAGVVLVAFVCGFVFHVGLSTLIDAARPKTPKLSVTASTLP